MNNVKKYAPLLGLSVLGAYILIQQIVTLAESTDAKYYPLIGTLGTVAVSLVASLIAFFALIVNQRNLMTPTRVEMEKKRTEIICTMILLVQESAVALDIWNKETDPEKATKKKETYVALYNSLGKQLMLGEVFLPRKLLVAVSNFRGKCRNCDSLITSTRGTNIVQIASLLDGLFFDYLDDVVAVCREALHTDELTEETKRLVKKNKSLDQMNGRNDAPGIL